MKQRLFSMLLAFAVILGIIPSVASAASTPEEALGEVNIYSGGYSAPMGGGDQFAELSDDDGELPF